MSTAAEFAAALRDRASALGFVRVGIARAEALGAEAERLRAWIRAGRHGEMTYMAETLEVRCDPRHPRMLSSAKSVVVLVTPFARTQERVGPVPGRVARYARGRDYHNVLEKRARKLTAWLRSLGHDARFSVDRVPVFERAWAQRAGVGFIGKNCCLIVPGLGSHVFLSVVLTSAELPADEPILERCGSCSLCLDACPTTAFVGPRELDARRCISYLTIENRGSIPPDLQPRMGDWIFGCDVCQDVCPYNRTAVPDASETKAFAPDARWRFPAEDLLAMKEDDFQAYAMGSPIRRGGRDGMARNAAVVLGNSGDRRHLPVLREFVRRTPFAAARDAAVAGIQTLEQ